MSKEAAKAFYTKQLGDPDSGYITPQDAMDSLDVVYADAVEAVQAELGTDPSGSAATVSARLDGIEDGTRLGVDSVGSAQIAANAVGASELADNAVTSAKIADSAVTSAKIAANAVGASELADNAVDTAAIQAKAVTAAKIADDTITATQIAANAVGASELADNAVTSAKIASGAVSSILLATLRAAPTLDGGTAFAGADSSWEAACGDLICDCGGPSDTASFTFDGGVAA